MDHSMLDTPAPTIFDRLGRPLRSLRLSVTDRCNLRCKYCMPEDDYAWLPRDTILTFEEMAELTAIFTELGVDKVRLTGGEPLLRRDLPRFVRQLSENRRITEIALTSNGVLMADQAADLSFAGIPLTSGFIGKWAVFTAAWSGGVWQLVVLAVLLSALAAYFYVRVIVLMFFTDPVGDGPTVAVPSMLTTVVIGFAVLATIGLGILPGPVLDLAQHAGAVVR